MNERLYNANVELVDKNKLLEDDKRILQKKIDTLQERIEYSLEIIDDFSIDDGNALRKIKKILKGELKRNE